MKKTMRRKILRTALGFGALIAVSAATAAAAAPNAGRASSPAAASRLTLVEDAAAGTLTVRDGAIEVLTYRFGDSLPAGADPRYIRSCYIHDPC